MRFVLVTVLMVMAAACSGGSGGDEDEITRIDGPAVVDEDLGGADNVATTDDPSGG